MTALRVRGDGPLAGVLRAALADMVAAGDGPALDVVVRHDDDPSTPDSSGRRLVVSIAPDRVRVGPLVAGGPGCDRCVQTRERQNRAVREPHEREPGRPVRAGHRTPIGGPVREVVAALVRDEVRAVRDGDPPRTAGAVLDVTVATVRISRHTFLPDPCCPVCGTLPDDTAEAGRMVLNGRPRPEPGGYRARDLAAETPELLRTLVDAKTGAIASVYVRHHDPMVVAEALCGPVCCTEFSGFARTFGYPQSVAVAVAEALERLGGMRTRARRTTVRSSFHDLGSDRAIDPSTLGLPAAPPDKHAVRYHPDLPLEWVHAYSFRRDGPVLVPESLAYFGSHATGFGGECSNGCAIGGSLEEAILHGIFEVAERDAFLSAWLTRRPARRVDPRTSSRTDTRMLVSWLEDSTGGRLRVFDITMPERLPVLWLMLVDPDDRAGEPKVLCGAGAHLDPERALYSGLVELAAGADTFRAGFDPRRADELFDHPELVHKMDDHAVLAAARRSWPRFGFLDHDGDPAAMAEAFPPAERHRPAATLRDDLLDVAGRYPDVVVVDQTALEHTAVGLHSVKVLVPGTVPMAFGHGNRRVGDLDRLLHLPVRLGYRRDPLRSDDLNPFPHPFP
ncbi:TOMM precursor leader peptide-binding protein [Jidongwangia harbinensis]|uniref:TOMM precursor leader peptide-binding protein n=1 Tax=Jidongwangia harbinensis TaxID=2878561 RepID=UPI001CD98FEA|nr:TOMM precursor leader peptide-binding protein [Jidongwangia harbinensis]MCA2216669.1 TOMM precursor leader peptide-binding protein [Jidongwangia harbinensis]